MEVIYQNKNLNEDEVGLLWPWRYPSYVFLAALMHRDHRLGQGGALALTLSPPP